jgi:hypothetical protein
MEFIPASETAKQEVLSYALKTLTDTELREELSRRGFYTSNLWHVDDVKERFNADDDDAQEILDSALTNDATMEQIWLAIEMYADDNGFNRIEE